MATVSGINSLPSSQHTAGATGSNSNQNGSSSTSGTGGLANESTFLQLLVAQLQHQDPATPMDGTTFVTQLAQFSDLEQNLAMRQDLDALSAKYAGITSQTTAANPSATQTSSTPTV